MSLLQAVDGKKQMALTGAQSLAGLQQQRDANNDAIESAEDSQRASGAGMAVGMGVQAGMMFGPQVGLVVGGAMLLATLF